MPQKNESCEYFAPPTKVFLSKVFAKPCTSSENRFLTTVLFKSSASSFLINSAVNSHFFITPCLLELAFEKVIVILPKRFP